MSTVLEHILLIFCGVCAFYTGWNITCRQYFHQWADGKL